MGKHMKKIILSLICLLIVSVISAGESKQEAVEVEILSEPSEADVFINSVKNGKTPLMIYLVPGKYELKLAKRGTSALVQTIEVKSNSENKFSFNLTDNRGTLNLVLNPADAEVRINEESYTNQNRIKLKPGHYKIEIKKNGYASQTEEFDLNSGQELNKVFDLKDNAGILSLSVLPEGAKVLINNTDYTGQKEIKLSPGQYKIEVSKEGCLTQTDGIVIATGQKVEKSYNISGRVGILQFFVTPPDAKVVLKKNGLIQKSWVGAKYLRDAPEGNCELEISASGYITIIDSIVISDKQINTKKIVLEKGINVPKGFVYVEGGTFIMGGFSTDAKGDEYPEHEVTVSSFFIGKYELTVGEFRKFVTETNYVTTAEYFKSAMVWIDDWTKKDDANWKNPYYEQTDKYPVSCMSWTDAVAYCNWRSRNEGLTPCYSETSVDAVCDLNADGYRLPTESEWEFAAKGGVKSKKFDFIGGNTCDEVAWFKQNSENRSHEVGGKTANELGIFDMAGNVSEWCWDWYDNYEAGKSVNPKGPAPTYYKVLRGGGWYNYDSSCRPGNRSYSMAKERYSGHGFRIVRNYR